LVDKEKKLVEKAIDNYHKKTCIRWIPRTSQQDYVNFIRLSVSNSYAEKCHTGNVRNVLIGESTNSVGSMIQLLSQVLCFFGKEENDDKLRCPRNQHGGLGSWEVYDEKIILLNSCAQELSVLDAQKLNELYNCTGLHDSYYLIISVLGI